MIFWSRFPSFDDRTLISTGRMSIPPRSSIQHDALRSGQIYLQHYSFFDFTVFIITFILSCFLVVYIIQIGPGCGVVILGVCVAHALAAVFGPLALISLLSYFSFIKIDNLEETELASASFGYRCGPFEIVVFKKTELSLVEIPCIRIGGEGMALQRLCEEHHSMLAAKVGGKIIPIVTEYDGLIQDIPYEQHIKRKICRQALASDVDTIDRRFKRMLASAFLHPMN